MVAENLQSKTVKPTEKKPLTVKAENPEVKSGSKPPTKSDRREKPAIPVITEVRASANFVRMAPRKVRLVAAQMQGKEVETAQNYLRFVPRIAAQPIQKLLHSAVANAENNFQFEKHDLFIKKLTANEGPVIKRFRPRAHGRSALILKRTSHIDLILGIKAGAKRGTVAKKAVKAEEPEVKVVAPQEVKKDSARNEGKGPDAQNKGQSGFLKKVFNRKTG